jgi:hypothetical protein
VNDFKYTIEGDCGHNSRKVLRGPNPFTFSEKSPIPSSRAGFSNLTKRNILRIIKLDKTSNFKMNSGKKEDTGISGAL